MHKPQQKKISLVLVSLVGAIRASAALPIQHPFDTVKTWMQSRNVSAVTSMQQIYKQKGIKGFYSGFMLNMLRVSLKQAYRWPLNIFLIDRFRTLFGQHQHKNTLAGVFTGLATALIQSFVICPLERVKVWLMTSPQNKRIRHFFSNEHWPSLFKGFNPVVIKQALSWVSFLGSQEYLKDVFYRYRQKQRKQALSNSDLLAISVLVCLFNTLMVMPADYVKTYFQKYQSQQQLQLFSTLGKLWRQAGIRGLYRGGMVKIVHYNVNAMLTVPLFQKMLRQYSY